MPRFVSSHAGFPWQAKPLYLLLALLLKVRLSLNADELA
jgi:hypothetical protein